eukprot:TRINITY_DN4866_c0_g1_i2.p1 TRINITY_DN4866_c0_g1~~TRINITY_DN4866_c0_g1_i2.p1  ORF type:complete len:741 (+),score=182.99 TRINITY_DN4866_c0_g1_i2:76-2223(+)
MLRGQPLLGLAKQVPSDEKSEPSVIENIKNRISQEDSVVGGAEMPRPPSLRESQPPLTEQEQLARNEVLSHPTEMKTLASKMGRDLWENLMWSERLKLLSESMKVVTPTPVPSCVPSASGGERHSLQAPLPPLEATETSGGRLSSDGPLPATNAPDTPVNLPVAPSPSFVDSPTAADPAVLNQSPPSNTSFNKPGDTVVKFNDDPTPAEPKLEKRKSSRRSSVRSKRSERERKAAEKARKELLEKHQLEVQETLKKEVPKGALKRMKDDNPDYKLMKIISTQDKQKKRRKRVVIIEPDEMVVANPTTGQQVRRMALDRLSAIDYQDKEYGRSVVLRFDGEADAAFIQTDKHITDVPDSDDELMSTTMRMAHQCRVDKKLPPRSIKPIRYPLYRDLLASANQPADDECELTAWEKSVQASNPPSASIPAVGSLHTKPITPQCTSIGTLETITPHNTIRLGTSTSGVGGKDPNIPHATITRTPLTPGQPASVVATTTAVGGVPLVMTDSTATNKSVISSRASQSPSRSHVAADVQPAADTPPARQSSVTPPLVNNQPERHPLPEAIRWKIENNANVKALLLKAAGAARKARGGVGPSDAELVSDLIARAETEIGAWNLLVQTAERASHPDWNPSEMTVHDIRERLSSHYEKLSVAGQQQFEATIAEIKSISPDAKACVVSHTVVDSGGNSIPDTSIPSPTGRSISPVRLNSAYYVHC